APCITFANVNANSTIYSLTFLDFPHTLIVFVDEIGTDPSDMSSIPLNFKLPANSVFRGIFHLIIVLPPGGVLALLILILYWLPGSIVIIPLCFGSEPTHIVLNIGLLHIPQGNVFKCESNCISSLNQI